MGGVGMSNPLFLFLGILGLHLRGFVARINVVGINILETPVD
jgi:hypothetical protein